MKRSSDSVYEFGPSRLEVGERRLSDGGHPVPLRAKVFETLRMLVEHHGRLVRKDDLLAAVWPDTTVEETNLSHNIAESRRAFAEGRSRQPYIETVSKSGYRFIADVREIKPPEERT